MVVRDIGENKSYSFASSQKAKKVYLLIFPDVYVEKKREQSDQIYLIRGVCMFFLNLSVLHSQ